VTDLLGKVLLFVPRVLVALLVLVFGSYFSRALSGNAVQRYCRSAGISDAELLGRLACSTRSWSSCCCWRWTTWTSAAG
jgi:hypothetical protein